MPSALVYAAYRGNVSEADIRAQLEPAIRAAGFRAGPSSWIALPVSVAARETPVYRSADVTRLNDLFPNGWTDADAASRGIFPQPGGWGLTVTSGPFAGDVIEQISDWPETDAGFTREPLPTGYRAPNGVVISAFKQLIFGDLNAAARGRMANALRSVRRGGEVVRPYISSSAVVGGRLVGDRGVPATPRTSGGGGWLVLALLAGYAATRSS